MIKWVNLLVPDSIPSRAFFASNIFQNHWWGLGSSFAQVAFADVLRWWWDMPEEMPVVCKMIHWGRLALMTYAIFGLLTKKTKEMVLVVWFLDPKSYQSYIRTFLSISRSTEKLQALQFR